MHGDVADGRFARGPGASEREIQQVVVALDETSAFSEVRRTLAPVVRRLDLTPQDRATASAIGRSDAASAVILPIAIRQRVVLFLYGDRGSTDFDLGDVMDLVRLAPRIQEAFERLILIRKAPADAQPTPPTHAKPKSGDWRISGESSDEQPIPQEPVEPPKEADDASPGHAKTLGIPRQAPPPPSSSSIDVTALEPREPTPAPSVDGSYSKRDVPVDVIASVPPPASEEPPSSPTELSAPFEGLVASEPPTEDDRLVIVDMGEDVHTEVQALLRTEDREAQDRIIDRLMKLGPTALPVLAQSFRDGLPMERPALNASAYEIGPLCRAFARFGEQAASYVAALLSADHSDERYCAALVAHEVLSPELIAAVIERVYDDDAGVRRLARGLLPRLSNYPAFAEHLKVLRRTARIRGKVLARRRHAIEAIGALRDTQSIPKLIELFEDDDPELPPVLARTLAHLTCVDIGTSVKGWESWWEQHKDRHRIEWLIDGLSHSDPRIRAHASAELKAITQEYFGYHPTSAKKEREHSARKYREWWEREGHRRFLEG